MKTYVKYTKNIVVVVLLVLLIYSYWSKHQQKQQFKSNLEVLNDTISTYKLKTGELVSEKEVLQVTNRDIKDQLYIKDSMLSSLVQKYRKVQSTTTVNTVTVIDSVLIRSERVDSANYKFSHNTKFFDISGSYNDERLLIDSLALPNTQNQIIGIKKGFFNNKITSSITNSNPFISVVNMNTQITTISNKRFGIGLHTGIGLDGKPSLSLGLNFNLIQF